MVVNGRFELRRPLLEREGRVDHLAGDLQESGRPCVVSILSGSEADGAYARWRMHRGLFCPSLLRPYLFQRIHPGDGAITVRSYLAGEHAPDSIRDLAPPLLQQFAETMLYLSMQGLSGICAEPGLMVSTGDSPRRLQMLDLPPGDGGGPEWEPVPPLSGRVADPLIARQYRPPIRVYGLDRILTGLQQKLPDTMREGGGALFLMHGGDPRTTHQLCREMLADLENSGWLTIEARTSSELTAGDSILASLSPAAGSSGTDLGGALAAFSGGRPLCVEIRLRSTRLGELGELVSALGDATSAWAVMVRTDRRASLPGGMHLPTVHEVSAEAVSMTLEETLPLFLAAEAPPEGLLEHLRETGARRPEDVLSVIRMLSGQGTLARHGAEWEFQAAPASRRGEDGLQELLGKGAVEREILALLAHAASALGAAAIAFVLEEDPGTTAGSLEKLEKEGLVVRTGEKHRPEWTAGPALPRSILLEGGDTAEWEERLVTYSLASPAATLSELLAAALFAGEDPGPLGKILYDALMLSRESGELDLTASLAGRIAGLPSDTYSSSEAETILLAIEPSRLEGLDGEALRPFLESWAERERGTALGTIALTRLAELDFREGEPGRARRILDLLLEDCFGGQACSPVAPMITSLAVRVFSALDAQLELASRLAASLREMPGGMTAQSRMMIRAWTAVAFALSARIPEAFAWLDQAGEEPVAGEPEARQVLEMCRGRVYLHAGELSRAAESLERALLLAENRKDAASVSEILSYLIVCEERLPGYSIRSMIASMKTVHDRAVAAENVQYSAFALSRLAALSVRMLDFGSAARLMEEYSRLGRDPSSSESAYLSWYRAFMAYQCGRGVRPPEADEFIPGTLALLEALEGGGDPGRAAETIASSIRENPSFDRIPAGIYLALEAWARGAEQAARAIGAVLADKYRPTMEEVIPAWRLCINAMQTGRHAEAERVLWTAQIAARQLDRLLLVWLILQARSVLDLPRSRLREVEAALLTEELDRHVEAGLDTASAWGFASLDRLKARRAGLGRVCGLDPAGDLREIRDGALELLRREGVSFPGLEQVGGEPAVRSDVGWGLETLTLFSSAMRISVLHTENSRWETMESRGFGTGLPPTRRMEEVAGSSRSGPAVLDCFGRDIFGSRFIHAVELGRTPSYPGVDRRAASETPHEGHYLVVETDSPFDTLSGERQKVFLCFAKQIGASIALRELERQTQHDSMTGARIAAMWFARLKDLLSSGSISRQRPLAILMLDLDFFKAVNDGFGHREGDLLLRRFVECVTATVRPNDVVGRLGGEEFGVILPGASERNALTIAERIRRRVSAEVLRPDRRPVTVSIGISVAPIHGEAAELLLRRADVALYESKDNGRDRSTLWNPSMSSTFSGKPAMSILETGDPGWDLQIGRAALRLASEPVVQVGRIADEIRNALRCEYLMMDAPGGDPVSFGPPEILSGLRDIEDDAPGVLREMLSADSRYLFIRVGLAGGGRILAAWRASESVPKGMGALLGAFAHLAEALTAGNRR